MKRRMLTFECWIIRLWSNVDLSIVGFRFLRSMLSIKRVGLGMCCLKHHNGRFTRGKFSTLTFVIRLLKVVSGTWTT